MPPLVALLIKLALPYIIKALVAEKIIPATVGEAIQDFEDFKSAIANIKYYHESSDFPVQKDKFNS